MSVSDSEVAAACAMLREERPLERHYIAAMLEAQQAEIERLQKDAERLSWLDRDDVTLHCSVDSFGDPLVTLEGSKGRFWSGRNIREAIDAALAAPVNYPRITEPPAAPVPNEGWGKRRKPKAGA